MSAMWPPGPPMAAASTVLAGPMNVGGALGTPTSFCQSRPTRPVAVRTIINTKASTTASDTMPSRSSRRRRQAACHTPSERGRGDVPASASGDRIALIAPPSFQDHPRIDQLVEDVNEEVDEHRDHRQVDREGLDHRIVAAIDGQDDLAADAGDREEDLDQERADEDTWQRQADVG